MSTITITVDLGAEAAGSVEFAAETIERELNRLDALEAAAAPGAARDDADFQRWRHQLRGSLVVLRGLGLLLSDQQAQQARCLWAAAFELTAKDLDAYPRQWYAAVHALDNTLPHVERADA